jgi:tetratricopeptide (TPR) repeat protein/predicted Ser/Thr protein kinase
VAGEDTWTEGPPEASVAPRRGRLAGRYVLLDEIGEGGAGVVLQAFDRELERRVAIKLVKTPERSGISSTRLRREAQANALLQHPNVVSIFDVGEHDGEVFIAMEYVSGGSLRDWLRTSRSTPEILDVFAQAGRGLLAAHERGIVHRDFKPSNVLVGMDGRARVADFGLARSFGDVDAVEPDAPRPGGLVELELTRTGAVQGTPAYMAPEQFIGGTVDARADQFAFCLSLAEALTGTASPRTTTTAPGGPPEAWDPRAWLRRSRMAPRLRDALLRGLSTAPEDRFSSLEPILDAIDSSLVSGRSWTRWSIGLGSLLVVGVGGVVMATAQRPCTGLKGELDGVWDDTRRQALASTRSGGPAEGWALAWMRVDAYAASWVEAKTEVCAATRLRGEQSEELLDARMTCLDRRLDALSTLLALVEGERVSEPSRAAEAVLRLPSPTRCVKAERLDAAASALPPNQAAAVGRLQPRLRELEALLAAGLFDEGIAAGGPILQDAEATNDPRSKAEALALLARLQQGGDRYEEARESWEQAAVEAETAGDDGLRYDSYLGLVRLDQGTSAEVERTDRNVERARALLARRRWGPRRRAALEASLSQLMLRRGKLVACREHGEQARVLLEDAPDDAFFGRLQASEDLAACLARLGARREAAKVFREILADAESELGAEHPRVGRLNWQLSRALDFSGDREGAEAAARRALTISQKALGNEHTETARAHQSLANVLFRRGDFDGSARELRRAVEIMAVVHGPESNEVGALYSSLGLSLVRLGRFEEGIATHRRAVDILTRVLGPRHPQTGAARGRYGAALQDSGDLAGAIPECRIAQEILEESDPRHARILDQIRCFTASLIRLGRSEEAVAPLLEGIELSKQRDETPYYTALLEFQAAQALGATGSNERARVLAASARTRLTNAGIGRELLADIEAWFESAAATSSSQD